MEDTPPPYTPEAATDRGELTVDLARLQLEQPNSPLLQPQIATSPQRPPPPPPSVSQSSSPSLNRLQSSTSLRPPPQHPLSTRRSTGNLNLLARPAIIHTDSPPPSTSAPVRANRSQPSSPRREATDPCSISSSNPIVLPALVQRLSTPEAPVRNSSHARTPRPEEAAAASSRPAQPANPSSGSRQTRPVQQMKSKKPSQRPKPGRPLLFNSFALVYPAEFSCWKCANSGYKRFNPATPCRTCWVSYGKAYVGPIVNAPWGNIYWEGQMLQRALPDPLLLWHAPPKDQATSGEGSSPPSQAHRTHERARSHEVNSPRPSAPAQAPAQAARSPSPLPSLPHAARGGPCPGIGLLGLGAGAMSPRGRWGWGGRGDRGRVLQRRGRGRGLLPPAAILSSVAARVAEGGGR
jgi:hypothetical protein